ncbi:hypothetical protein U9868_25135, partial [Escherichia coli]
LRSSCPSKIPVISKLALVLDIYPSLSLILRYIHCLAFQGAGSTLKEQGTFPIHATEMTQYDQSLHFNMTTANIDYASFPFVGLKNNQFMMVISGHTCVSYPK